MLRNVKKQSKALRIGCQEQRYCLLSISLKCLWDLWHQILYSPVKCCKLTINSCCSDGITIGSVI